MKTPIEIETKFIELQNSGGPHQPEELYMWLFPGKIPEAHCICRGEVKLNFENDASELKVKLNPFKDDEDTEETLIFDSSKFYKSLISSTDYVYTVKTFYEIPQTYGIRVLIIMKDAILSVNDFSEHKEREFKVYSENSQIALKYCEMAGWENFSNPDEIEFGYLTTSYGKLKPLPMKSPKIEVDLEKNYNSDLPIQEITSFLESSEAGLIILNGEPGTGKSSLIKYLIGEYQNKDWVMVPSKILKSITSDQSSLQYFASSQNRVYILEDCEKLLIQREKGSDLEDFLNLTDGLLGDALMPKFICTFNTQVSNVDPAILRKGRLKLRYEFGPLSLDKTRLHIQEATRPMVLADIYNQSDNGGIIKTPKIGY